MGRLGKRVVLVERSDRMYGGTCPNVGCVLTKALVHHAGKRRPEDAAQEWYERSVTKVQAVTKMMRDGNYEGLNGMETVTVLTGQAAFVDPHTVAVQAGRERLTVTADTILINTGSEPIIRDIPGLRDSQYTVTSTELIETTVLPERLTIIGGGYLGLEFAAIYRRFGSQVTVLEASPKILGRVDDDVAAVAQDILTDEGIEIIAGTQVSQVRDGDGGATVFYDKDGHEHSVAADAILAATGRAPGTATSPWRRPGSVPPSGERSRSTRSCAPASRTSTPSATSTAVRSSPTSPSTTAASSSISSSVKASAPRRTGWPSRTRCS